VTAPRFRQSAEQVEPVKTMLRDAWNAPGAGYAEMADTLRPAVTHLLDFLGIEPGMRLLDAATGTGIAAIEAARAGARVTGVDFAPDLVQEARRAAQAAGLHDITFDVADIEQLPYPDASFDAVLSSFGSIFSPRHDATAHELLRVLRPGGVLAFSSWKPEGPNMRLMTIMAPYLPPPPAGGFDVFDWGKPEYVAELLGDRVDHITYDHGNVPWLNPSPSDVIDMLFQRALGPTIYFYRRFDDATKLRVHTDAIRLVTDCLQPNGSVRIDRHYLLTKAVRARR
jgi:ubiquinone/menaquinone biosynthesis C-methylase UbiE